VEREIREGVLKEVRLRQMNIERRLYMVYRQDRALSAAAQELVEIVGRKPGRSMRAAKET
jgi:DNA-binding transcriptional LysR family regulator